MSRKREKDKEWEQEKKEKKKERLVREDRRKASNNTIISFLILQNPSKRL